jgi:hypothetical protein
VSPITSTDLLAILYLLENDRKGLTATCSGEAWTGFLEAFSPRLRNISEDLRRELLEAHLMSVEDFDVFDENFVAKWREENAGRIHEIQSALKTHSL